MRCAPPRALRLHSAAWILLTLAFLPIPVPAQVVAATEAGAASITRQGLLADRARERMSKVWHGAQDVALYALSMLGVDYRYGGAEPDGGLDCSGLIQYVFQQVTGATLPRTTREMSQLGRKVALKDLKPGDLVFFNTRRLPFSHVGLYLGEDRFIHAPRAGAGVEIVSLSSAYWQKRFMGARRLVGVLPQLMPEVVSAARAQPFEMVVPVAASFEAGVHDHAQ